MTVALDELAIESVRAGAMLLECGTMKKVNIREELASLDEYWSQKVIGEANGQLFKVARGIGEVNWHKHDDQDELFILFRGHLTIRLRTENIELHEGDMFVVPKGIEHSPAADGDVEFLIVGLDITSTEQGGKPAWSHTRNG